MRGFLTTGALPFSERTAQQLMAIAGNKVLANPIHGSGLPSSWRIKRFSTRKRGSMPRIKRSFGKVQLPHKVKTVGPDRPSPRDDPRNSRRWKKFSKWFLSKNPLCVDCMGVGFLRGATDTHHRVALSKGGSLYDSANCMALCHSCHSRRTARGE